ncbi:hypothetical protein [Streptomyces sp. NPDC058307]|uniref:hypothetical protein n=1 Tax=Streptomyces sp. NPDC058307 TaxID=3346439 RepID=UPI0036E3B52A
MGLVGASQHDMRLGLIVGYMYTNPSWFDRRYDGGLPDEYVGGPHPYRWAWTEADNGQWGWMKDTAISAQRHTGEKAAIADRRHGSCRGWPFDKVPGHEPHPLNPGACQGSAAVSEEAARFLEAPASREGSQPV